MARLSLSVAFDANDGHAIELTKHIGHTILPLKGFLAGVTPRLKVVWVLGVLDKARRWLVLAYQVTANNSGNALAVGAAINL
jgi:hypothetical protein